MRNIIVSNEGRDKGLLRISDTTSSDPQYSGQKKPKRAFPFENSDQTFWNLLHKNGSCFDLFTPVNHIFAWP